EPDDTPCTLTAHLRAGATISNDDDVLAELLEYFLIPALETLAQGGQNDDRDHTPHDPEHCQKASKLVRTEVLDGLLNGFAHRGWRSARQHQLLALAQAFQHLRPCAIADADLDGRPPTAAPRR